MKFKAEEQIKKEIEDAKKLIIKNEQSLISSKKKIKYLQLALKQLEKAKTEEKEN